MVIWRVFSLVWFLVCIIVCVGVRGDEGEVKCEDLLDGQYPCFTFDIVSSLVYTFAKPTRRVFPLPFLSYVI